MIGDAVQAYLATLEAPDPREELGDEWFREFDETAHVAYELERPRRLGRLGAWLRRSRRSN